MNLVQLSNFFGALAEQNPYLSSYVFGWPSDRVRLRTLNDATDTEVTFPRLLFAPPEGEHDTVRQQETIDVTLYFDDLLGYDDDGTADDDLQVQKWEQLKQAAYVFLRHMVQASRTLAPDTLAVNNNRVRWTLDSFTGQARMITVMLTFQVITNTVCDATAAFDSTTLVAYNWPPATTPEG